MVCAVAPEVPLNIFSFAPGLTMLNFVKNNILAKNLGGILLEKSFVFCGNFFYWLIITKICLIIAIELIICSTIFVKLINCFETKSTQFRCDTRSLKLYYRQIQILVDSFNKIMSAQLVVFSITFGTGQISVALDLFRLSLSTQQTFAELASKFWLSTYNVSILCNISVVINLLFGCCAEVNYISHKVNSRIKRKKSLKTSLEHKLFLKSISDLKIKFGSTNYLERLTPVMFQVYLVERLIDILLLR